MSSISPRRLRRPRAANHVQKWRRGKLNPETRRYKICSHEDCKKPRTQGAYCEAHFKEKRGIKPESAPAAAPAAPAA